MRDSVLTFFIPIGGYYSCVDSFTRVPLRNTPAYNLTVVLKVNPSI